MGSLFSGKQGKLSLTIRYFCQRVKDGYYTPLKRIDVDFLYRIFHFFKHRYLEPARLEKLPELFLRKISRIVGYVKFSHCIGQQSAGQSIRQSSDIASQAVEIIGCYKQYAVRLEQCVGLVKALFRIVCVLDRVPECNDIKRFLGPGRINQRAVEYIDPHFFFHRIRREWRYIKAVNLPSGLSRNSKEGPEAAANIKDGPLLFFDR